MKKPRFTGNEDRALIQIATGLERIRWSKVIEELKERGFPERTEKSVRNRYLRLRVHEQLRRVEPDRRNINRCKTCGLFMRGHVCGGLQGPNVEESVSGGGGGGDVSE